MVGMGFMEMLIVMMFGGGFLGGGVMGLPPGERDAKLVQCPPKDVILYTEWASRGEGKAGAKGVDGLAADPEILAFIEAVDRAIMESIARNSQEGQEKVFAENIPLLVKLLLNRPGCLYLDVDPKLAIKLMSNPPDLPEFTPPMFGMLPAIHATVIFNGGDQADAIQKHIEALIPEEDRVKNLQHQKFPIPMEGASLVLHRHESYFILGWGEATVDNAVKGLKGESQGLKANERFQAGMERVRLERTGSVAWFDLKSLVNKAVQGLGPQGLVVAAVVQQLGLETVESLAMCSGVVDGQLHSKGFLKTGGKTEGLMALAAGRPLTAKDFEAVPGDADLVFAFTMDFPKILSTTRKLIAQAGEEPKENFEAVFAQLEKELGVSFENDVFKAFGQSWLLYDSPSNGGVLFTAPVLGLEVIDQAAAQKTFVKLMDVLKLAVPGEIQAGRFGRGVYLEKKTFMDHEVYYINPVGREEPFAPAFTLTKTHLLVSPHPQQLKAHLRFLASKEPRFSEKFAKAVTHEGGELFAVCHSEPQLFARYLATISPIFSTMIFGQIQREGAKIDGFDFPSARAFLPYLGNGLLTKERTEDGILFNSRHGLPVPGMSAMMMVFPMIGFWTFTRMEMRAAPAQAVPIQINQHIPKLPAEKNVGRTKPLRFAAS